MKINARIGQSVWPWGIALLRIVVGIVFVMHGQQKLFEMGVGGVSGFFASLGVPAPQLTAVVVSLLETVGGVALILGVLTRLFGLLLTGDMLVALLLVHRPNGFFAGDGGVELVLLLGTAALALALTGPGALALDNLKLLQFERRFQWSGTAPISLPAAARRPPQAGLSSGGGRQIALPAAARPRRGPRRERIGQDVDLVKSTSGG